MFNCVSFLCRLHEWGRIKSKPKKKGVVSLDFVKSCPCCRLPSSFPLSLWKLVLFHSALWRSNPAMLRTCLRSASIFLLFSTFAISRSGAQLPLDAWEDSTSSLTNFHVDSTSDHYILDSLLEPFSTASVLEEGGIDGSTSDDIVHLYPYPSSSDDLFEHDLLLGLNDDCYFDASFADPGSVNLFIKRASEGACKTPTRDSTQPSRPDNDPNDFLNSLPIFEPEPGSEFHENLEVCPPLLVGEGRKFPVCRQGHSALAEKYDDVYAQGDRHDCAPCISPPWIFHPEISRLTI